MRVTGPRLFQPIPNPYKGGEFAMRIRYGCDLSIVVAAHTPALCLVDVHPERRPDILDEQNFSVEPGSKVHSSIDVAGNLMRRFVVMPGETRLRLSGTINDSGKLDERDPHARAVPVCELPPGVLPYLNGSRYCETDKLSSVAWSLFGGLPAGTPLVEDICAFAHEQIRFDYAQARSTRTAMEALEESVGVCRDFTHLAVALCRCMNIPSRYVNGYLGDIGVPHNPDPMDFNAWFEVYLDGRWFTFDARHDARRIGRIPIARGRDAGDVPMLQTFGPHILRTFNVITHEVSSLETEKLAG